MAKMKEHSRAYTKEAIKLALSVVTIKQCQDCGHPVIDGYCCSHCDSASPTHRDQEESWIDI
jgi:ribosomal protein L32